MRIVWEYEIAQLPSSPMENRVQNAEQGVKKAWPVLMSWVGGITALIGLGASIAGGFTWLANHHKQQADRQAKMALAQAQAKQQEYQAAIQTYSEILKATPMTGLRSTSS